MKQTRSALFALFQVTFCSSYCIHQPFRTFHLIKRCQRSTQAIIELENVATLNDCFELAERSKALAINFSPLRGVNLNLFETNQSNARTNFPRRSNRRHVLDQPEEYFNCHALQCPESSEFTTMINDSRFDYYSMYGNPLGPKDFVCVPEIGIFHLNMTPATYAEAYLQCRDTKNGTLALIASETRTIALSKLLQGSGYTNGSLRLAYVGLNFTAFMGREFQTSTKEDLSCFLYRAWAPGHPKRDKFVNASCVAVTTENTWMTNECGRKLPYICEIYASFLNKSLYQDACDGLRDLNQRSNL